MPRPKAEGRVGVDHLLDKERKIFAPIELPQGGPKNVDAQFPEAGKLGPRIGFDELVHRLDDTQVES